MPIARRSSIEVQSPPSVAPMPRLAREASVPIAHRSSIEVQSLPSVAPMPRLACIKPRRAPQLDRGAEPTIGRANATPGARGVSADRAPQLDRGAEPTIGRANATPGARGVSSIAHRSSIEVQSPPSVAPMPRLAREASVPIAHRSSIEVQSPPSRQCHAWRARRQFDRAPQLDRGAEPTIALMPRLARQASAPVACRSSIEAHCHPSALVPRASRLARKGVGADRAERPSLH